MNKQKALERVSSLSRKIAKSELSLDEWKWQRAEAMAAAAEAGATRREIATAAGFKSHQPVSDAIKIVARYPSQPRPPYAEAYDAVTGFDRGAAQARSDAARTKRLLTEAPLEQVEQIIGGLSKDRQQAIGAAAKESYLKARQDHDEREARMTPADRKERELGRQAVGDLTDGIINSFSPMTIINHLESASEELSSATQRGGLTYEQMHQIDEADERWRSSLAFAKEMAGDHSG